MPFFLLCDRLQKLEDGFAAFRMIATCRQAKDAAELVADQLRATRRALLNMLANLQAERPQLPGFEPPDVLQMAMLRLTIWDPPGHRPILLQRFAFMQHDFDYVAQGNMMTWIQQHPQYHGLGPLEVLCAMNPHRRASASFQTFINVLQQGDARFFYSPIVFDSGEPMQEQLTSGPGLAIVVRYQGFPLVFCFRYTEAYYVETVLLPWLAVRQAVINQS